jgi:uncharacterized protein (TIGR00299 family) protein
VKIAYFDPFSGASGDMILGALLDAGLSLNALTTELSKLGLEGYSLAAERTGQHGIHGTRFTVTVTDDAHSRDWATIREIIAESDLDAPVKAAATAVFERLAHAEAKVHDSDIDHIHFHEVGGVDAIVDICGACIGLALLGIEEVYSGAPATGSGFTQSMHGTIPVPAPATAELLASANAPIAAPAANQPEVRAELLTPTGAAILTTLGRFTRPSFVPSAVGYGFGRMELPWPNALRVWIGETAGESDGTADGEVLIETNIDDMNPQFFAPLLDALFAAGALDAWLTPITMKKGRPATLVSAIAPANKRQVVESALIEHSSTLGARTTPVERTKAARTFETVATRFGDVRLKLRSWNGRVIDLAPEYDDCAALAKANDVPIREVWNDAHRIGESYIGRRR